MEYFKHLYKKAKNTADKTKAKKSQVFIFSEPCKIKDTFTYNIMCLVSLYVLCTMLI